MLNRRYLRTAVMQGLYSLQMDWSTSLDLARQLFDDELWDVAFKAGKTTEWQNERKAEADEAFALVRRQPIAERTAVFFPEETRGIAERALRQANASAKSEQARRRKVLTANLEAAYEFYLRLLLLLTLLVQEIKDEEAERQARFVKPAPATEAELRLTRNAYIPILADTPALLQLAGRRGLAWTALHEKVRAVYRDNLKSNPYYQEYLALPEDSQVDDLRIFRWLLRVFLINAPVLSEVFEEENFAWPEIRQAVLHLMQDSVKAWQKAGEQGAFPIAQQGEDWQEAISFQQTLFDKTIERQPALLAALAASAPNWDVERIAMIDSILIQMALTEMIEFPSIPIKVTINEYLEIAKMYSTPQSQAFINGVLDTLSTKMVADKTIRKTGRGLIEG